MELLKNNISKLKHGFTLSEVLITLVIIGIVAALTIPTAINKYKDEEMKSQFKNAYSTIKQAIYKTEMYDFQGYAPCYYGTGIGANVSGCGSFFNALSKNLSTQKVCNSNALSGGCIPEYKTYAVDSGHEGFSQNYVENRNPAYVLSNGQILLPYFYSPPNGAMPLIMFDINGHKGPNAYGKDLFPFALYRNKDSGIFLKPTNPSMIIVSGGRTSDAMVKYAFAGIK